MQLLHYAAMIGKVEIKKYLLDSCNVYIPITVTALVSCTSVVHVVISHSNEDSNVIVQSIVGT